jgi:hypothetical protein
MQDVIRMWMLGKFAEGLFHKIGPLKSVESAKVQQKGHEDELQHRKERQGFYLCKQLSVTAISWYCYPQAAIKSTKITTKPYSVKSC